MKSRQMDPRPRHQSSQARDSVTLNGFPTLVRNERGRAGITGNLGLLWQF